MCGAPRSSQKYKTKAPSPCKGKIMIRVFGSCMSKLQRASAGPIEFLLKVIIGRHFMSHQTPPTKATLLIHAYGYVRCHAWQPFETGFQALQCNLSSPIMPSNLHPRSLLKPTSPSRWRQQLQNGTPLPFSLSQLSASPMVSRHLKSLTREKV